MPDILRIAMNLDQPIFAPRPNANENLRPSQDALSSFLAGTVKECGRELHIDDLKSYRRLADEAAQFEQRRTSDATQDLRERMLYDVLGHSRFMNAELPAVVEEYKYHLHALQALDFKGPVTVIKALQAEMGRLTMKRTHDIALMVKFKEMVIGQKKVLSLLKRQWMALTAELIDIAQYVKTNLAGIEKRCEAASSILSDFDIGKTKEQQLIEEIRTHFKKQLKEAMYNGRITKRDLENAKNEFAALTKEISALVADDISVMRTLYKELLGHVQKTGHTVDYLLGEIESKRNGSIKENRELFRQVEEALVFLVSGMRLEVKPVVARTDVVQDRLVGVVRKVMLNHFLDSLRKGRRSRSDRRTRQDRRLFIDLHYHGPERRSGKVRRSGMSRRRPEYAAG